MTREETVEEHRSLIKRLNDLHQTLAECGVQVEFDISTQRTIYQPSGGSATQMRIGASYSQQL